MDDWRLRAHAVVELNRNHVFVSGHSVSTIKAYSMIIFTVRTHGPYAVTDRGYVLFGKNLH